MNILIAGGAGFIGSHLCRRLIKENNRVICVDSLITGSKENIEDLLDNRNFAFIHHDICNYLKIEEPLDWVMHFASPASPKDYLKYPIETLKAGTLGTLICLGIAKAHRARFMLASTSEVYGDPAISPQPEEYWGNVNPIGPRSCYDEAKRVAEALTFAYHRQHGLSIQIIRIFNTYGPSMRVEDGRVVSNFIVQALKGEDLTVYGEGLQTRSFCFVDDLIEGIVRYMRVDYPGPLNLGSTFELKVLDLAKEVISLTGSFSGIKYERLPSDDPKQRKPDNSKARNILRWEPKINLEEGLKRTIPYFMNKLDLR